MGHPRHTDASAARERRPAHAASEEDPPMAPRVMTVSGPIPPDKLGFTLPHEHVGIYLWHTEKRWDYWELTPDEEIITTELRDLRRRGGGTLVELTLDGVG